MTQLNEDVSEELIKGAKRVGTLVRYTTLFKIKKLKNSCVCENKSLYLSYN